jgi:hypothetical protein
MRAKLLITIHDLDGDILAPKGAEFEWIHGEEYHRVCNHLILVRLSEVEFVQD